jgi:hypothetical protein
VENARRAARLLAASTLLLAIAGALEGFVSPIEWWPIEGKLAVSGTTLVLLIVYLRGGRRSSVSVPSDERAPERQLALSPVTALRGP